MTYRHFRYHAYFTTVREAAREAYREEIEALDAAELSASGVRRGTRVLSCGTVQDYTIAV